ncbi:hypothetical protein J8V57_06000 [Xenorhabdus sp. PB61.4]|uniref:hypothetical protein n=1 Tax=Xenorhabdus sp. PB61.4 TaxID=2788940 RepID=UPI001E4D2BA3|nr:hypothetical protein [Xenorhabdus sp. PB61.4]MCC8365837.1 hypothetical protein [Xenorhabdus sp. PB61.4]
MKKIFLCFILCLSGFLLTGCISGPVGGNSYALPEKHQERPLISTIDFSKADYGSVPSNYKKLVKDQFEAALKDPDSAKYSNWTQPRQEVIFENKSPVFGYSLCVNVNAKNSYGGYTGSQLHWIFIKNNQVKRIQNTTRFPYRMIFIGHEITC